MTVFFLKRFSIFALFLLVLIPSFTYAKDNSDNTLGMLSNILSNLEDVGTEVNKTPYTLIEAQEEAHDIETTTKNNEKEILNPWVNKLPFELTLEKIRTFIITGRAIQKSNRTWDTLIASAQNDETALEFYEQAAGDANQIIKQVKGITVDEYQDLYKLSISDQDFATLLRALHFHIYPDEATENINSLNN